MLQLVTKIFFQPPDSGDRGFLVSVAFFFFNLSLSNGSLSPPKVLASNFLYQRD